MPEIAQLRVSLRDTDPEVWRRIIVDSSLTLLELHTVLQVAMGWQDYHDHVFKKGDHSYEPPNEDGLYESQNWKDERKVKIKQLIKIGDKFDYQYDIGDNWWHIVEREPLTVGVPNVFRIAMCVEGENACPPEDVGGSEGYKEYRQLLRGKRRKGAQEALEWRGPFDPTAFSAHQATAAMSAAIMLKKERSEGFEWF